MTNKLANVFARGYAALEAEDLDGIQAAIAAAVEHGVDEDDPRLRYLEFMSGWLDESALEHELDDLFAGTGDLLDGAVRLKDVAEAARIVLDISDILIELGDIDEAEHALRSLTERKDLDPRAGGEARLLRAQVLLDYHEDPEEALALLDEVPALLHEDGGYIGLRAAVLLELDREADAIALLEREIERTDDTELRYQLGMVLRGAGHHEASVEQLLIVRERDIVSHEVDLDARIPPDEAADLRRQLEDVLDTLPEPVLNRLATASIRVERWASEAVVRSGCDPRTALAFEGRPASLGGPRALGGGEAQDQDDEGHIDAMIIYRDAIVAQIEVDEQIIDVLALSLVDESDRFFDLELFPGV
jgi:tetratricopeptide (TPR) repeat protein